MPENELKTWADEAEALLVELEWSGMVGIIGGFVSACPSCNGKQYHGHAPDCKLKALLEKRPK